MLGNFSCFCCRLLIFFKNKLFQINLLGTLSECQTGWIQIRNRHFWSNLFAKFISRQQQSPLARKALKSWKKESLYLTKLTNSISVIKKMLIKLLACSFSSLENNHFLSTSNKCQIILRCSKFVVLPSLGQYFFILLRLFSLGLGPWPPDKSA